MDQSGRTSMDSSPPGMRTVRRARGILPCRYVRNPARRSCMRSARAAAGRRR